LADSIYDTIKSKPIEAASEVLAAAAFTYAAVRYAPGAIRAGVGAIGRAGAQATEGVALEAGEQITAGAIKARELSNELQPAMQWTRSAIAPAMESTGSEPLLGINKLSFDKLRPAELPPGVAAIPSFTVSSDAAGILRPMPVLTLQPAESAAARIYRASHDSVVKFTRDRGSLGTGFVIDAENGIVATANHVVGESDKHLMVNFANGQSLATRLLVRDLRSDLALLKFEPGPTTPPALTLSETSVVKEGVSTHLIGYPSGSEELLHTHGGISRFELTSRPFGMAEKRIAGTGENIQTARIWHSAESWGGNSGGPLLLDDGTVAGIHTHGWSMQSSRGTASVHLQTLLDEVKSHPTLLSTETAEALTRETTAATVTKFVGRKVG
jgi:S1-C subfamily serine protease